jgi:hypothetical protein
MRPAKSPALPTQVRILALPPTGPVNRPLVVARQGWFDFRRVPPVAVGQPQVEAVQQCPQPGLGRVAQLVGADGELASSSATWAPGGAVGLQPNGLAAFKTGCA